MKVAGETDMEWTADIERHMAGETDMKWTADRDRRHGMDS